MRDLLARCSFPPSGTSVVCGVSGGPDSMGLLVLACAAGLHVTAVHVDHGFRPGSGEEADLVRMVSERFGAAFRSERVDVGIGPNQEERARAARRSVLGPAAMTGHTADDQAETLLINLLRGAGPTGLAAMRPGHTHPLLELRRVETHRLCVTLGIKAVSDPTNDDRRFVRNRVRHEVLPMLDAVSDRDVVPLLVRTANQMRAVDDGVNELAASLDPTDTRALAAAPPLLAVAALRLWLADTAGHPPSAAELERVLRVVRHEAIACEVSGGRRVARSDGVLRLVESR
jgi:tRNA(Ile)-lysidine synthase